MIMILKIRSIAEYFKHLIKTSDSCYDSYRFVYLSKPRKNYSLVVDFLTYCFV